MNCMEVWGGNEATQCHFTRPGLDIWIRSQMQGHAESGGSELHLVSSCASGRITRMLLADICGYGQRFAQIAGAFRELMRRNVNSVRQARFVREMSRRLDDASRQGGFASTLVSTYFAPTRSFTVCNAGHPPPLLFSVETGTWSVLKHAAPASASTEAAFGVVSPDEYQQFTTKLEIGDMVLNYSNALTECRDVNGRILGIDGLLSRLRQIDPQQHTEISATLLTQIQSEHADNFTTEDATLLLCRATARRVGWRDNALAPFRLLRPVSDATRIG